PFDRWSLAQAPLVGTPLAPFKHLMARADPKQVAAMVEASVEKAPTGAAPVPAAAPEKKPTPTPGAGAAAPSRAAKAPVAAGGVEPIAPTCSFDDFMKIDLRVARVLAASPVEGSKKLLQLRVRLGEVERTIFAGIRGSYVPDA